MRDRDLSLIISRVVSFLLIIIGFFFLGFISGKDRVFPYAFLNSMINNITVVAQELPVMLGMKPTHYLAPARKPGSGVTINELTDAGDHVAISSFFDGAPEIRLIRRDGTIVARWPARLSELLPDLDRAGGRPKTDWNVDIHGMVIERDGSAVFNFEYTALVKLDRCADSVWTLPHPTHHSIERAADGGYWIPGRRYPGSDAAMSLPPLQPPYREDLLLKVSADGEIERAISVPELFIRNGLLSLLTSTTSATLNAPEGSESHEITHVNDVEPLPADIADDFPQFAPGDLVVSLRSRNMLLVVDPGSERIKWWRIGPWLRQHDPDFQSGGLISVFDNRTDDTLRGRILGGSAVIAHDPATGETNTVWASSPEQPMYTLFRGKHELLPGGGVLITETNGGRILQTDPSGRVVWEYINRYDEDEIIEITGARVYPAAYFEGVDWSCNPAHQMQARRE